MIVQWNRSDHRDAAMHCHFKKLDPRHVTKRFHRVPTRKIKDILMRVDHGIKFNIIMDHPRFNFAVILVN